MQTLLLTPEDQGLSIQARVQKVLKWDDMQYAEFMYERGLEYLNLYIPDDPHGIEALQRSRIFWAWWKNHWAIREQAFLDNLGHCSDIFWMEYYKQTHCPHLLIDIIYPNAAVLENSYAKMISEFNKSMTS